MKRIYIITILAVLCGITAAAQGRPNIGHQSTGRDRIEFQLVEQPVITYDAISQTMTVTGCFGISNFELTITSMETQQIEFQELFEGSVATFNLAFLIDGALYRIDYVDSRGKTYNTLFEKSSMWSTTPEGLGVDMFDYNTWGISNDFYLKGK